MTARSSSACASTVRRTSGHGSPAGTRSRPTTLAYHRAAGTSGCRSTRSWSAASQRTGRSWPGAAAWSRPAHSSSVSDRAAYRAVERKLRVAGREVREPELERGEVRPGRWHASTLTGVKIPSGPQLSTSSRCFAGVMDIRAEPSPSLAAGRCERRRPAGRRRTAEPGPGPGEHRCRRAGPGARGRRGGLDRRPVERSRCRAVSGVFFDLFLTQPYGTLAVTNPDDVEALVLLLAVGVAVTELALWGRRQQAGVEPSARLSRRCPQRRGEGRRPGRRSRRPGRRRRLRADRSARAGRLPVRAGGAAPAGRRPAGRAGPYRRTGAGRGPARAADRRGDPAPGPQRRAERRRRSS